MNDTLHPDRRDLTDPAAWLMRALRRLRPREGWVTLVLAWVAVISLPAAAVAGGLVAGLEPIRWLATLGLAASWWLAHRRISAPAATALLVLGGVLAGLAWGVRVLGFGRLLPQTAAWLAWRLGEGSGPAPLITYFSEQWIALISFAGRVVWWLRGLFSGQGTPDNLVVIGLAGLLAWALAAWAGWWIVRRGQPLIGLLPTGVLLAQQVYWTADVRWALLPFLGATTLLLVAVRSYSLVARWERTGADYSLELRPEMMAAGAGIAALVLVLAPTIPFLASHRVSDAFWRFFEPPYRRVETSLGRSFAGAGPARSLAPPDGVAPGGLPRAHLLGGSPALGAAVALRARVRGLEPGQALYWRGQTYAHYTGRGWDEPARLAEVRLAAGESWDGSLQPSGAALWISSVEVLAAARTVLYAPGAPISLDHPYVALLRGPGDLAGLSAPGRPDDYTVLSAAPVIDPDALRRAGTRYPAEIVERYLQLPGDGATDPVEALDPRLTALARAWTAGAATPYDQAIAIERKLRQMPYTLNVPTPPAGREVVAWFLLDQRQGYCDYFASAMVVLARLNGIPARLAVGYASGAYDETAGAYTIREADAHSWPELYFPGYGWTPFEPTPVLAQPARDLAAGRIPPAATAAASPDLDAGLAELRGLAERERAAQLSAGLRDGVLAGLNGLLACWTLGILICLRRGRDVGVIAGPIGAAYDRLLRWGGRLGQPARPADTPREYVAALIGAGERAAGRARWGRAAAASASAILRQEAAALAQTYERALFAAPEPESSPGSPARWCVLWAALRRLWWSRGISRLFAK